MVQLIMECLKEYKSLCGLLDGLPLTRSSGETFLSHKRRQDKVDSVQRVTRLPWATFVHIKRGLRSFARSRSSCNKSMLG